MRLTRPVTAATGGLASLALALGVLSGSPAAAAEEEPFTGEMYLGYEVFDDRGILLRRDGGCDSTGPGEFIETAVSADGTRTTESLTIDGAVSPSPEAGAEARDAAPAGGQRVVGEITGSTRATQSGGSLNTLEYSASIQAEVTGEEDAECQATFFGDVEHFLVFDLAEDGWLSLDWSSSSTDQTSARISIGDGLRRSRSGVRSYFQAIEGGTTSQSTDLFLEAGTHVIEVDAGANLGGIIWAARDAEEPEPMQRTVSLDFDLSASFTPAGDAETRAAGTGKRYVNLPGAIRCSDGTARVTLKGNAKKLQSAKFFVDGKRVKTVKKPKKGQAIRIGGIPTTGDTTIKSVVKTKKVVKKKKKKNGKKVRKVIKPKKFSVSRDYLGCS